MKTLYIMRHAKSSWDDAGISDLERPLNERGKRTAPFMGGLMRRRGLLPDVILSSPAKRARKTAVLVKQGGSLDADIVFDEQIYEASPNNLRQAVAAIGGEFSSAMLVGHNPGIEGFIRYLTGSLEPMPTGALAVIELGVDSWSDVSDNCGELKTVIRPKEEME